MRQIELQILASDIHETDYTDCSDCAITRALQRTELPYEDGGVGIYFKDSNDNININREEYSLLASKVQWAYKNKRLGNPIEDFVQTITFYDLE